MDHDYSRFRSLVVGFYSSIFAIDISYRSYDIWWVPRVGSPNSWMISRATHLWKPDRISAGQCEECWEQATSLLEAVVSDDASRSSWRYMTSSIFHH